MSPFVKLSLLLLSISFRVRIIFGGNKVIQDKLEVVSYNKDYFENPRIKTFRLDDNLKAVNMTMRLKKDLPGKLMVRVKIHKLSNNEYRLLPQNITTDVCPFLTQQDEQIRRLKEHSNFVPCPIKQGAYHLSNLVIEEHDVPPYVPAGSYRSDSTLFLQSNNVDLITTRVYARIVPR